MSKPLPFKQRYTLQQRKEKADKQMSRNPDKIVIIVDKHPKSILPVLSNPRFLCEKNEKIGSLKSLLQKKIKKEAKSPEQGKHSFFISVNGIFPNPQNTLLEIYEKYKDEDGFLYFQYSNQQSL